MDSIPLRGVVEMKEAHIRSVSRSNPSKGQFTSMFVVDLFKNKDKIGVIELPGKSKYYADDVVENWETGIIKENNEHIIKS